jgi:CspA family cold shock protein
MASGKIKWFNRDKGYGFIKPDDGGNDVFLHISALQRAGIDNLKDDQKVIYNLEEQKQRISAVEIQLLD